MITVRLILNSHPKPNQLDSSNDHSIPSSSQDEDQDLQKNQQINQQNWTENDFLKLLKINLNYKNITKIDNLELFYEVQELYLSGNKISVIENIDFLYKLKILDLSDNVIESDQLQPENFPSSLRQLIISGNPCVSDINAINNLQKALPQLEIITEEAEEEEEDENDEDDDDEEKAMESKNNSLPETLSNDIDTLSITSMNNIDPELVLREVVDRKCRLQSLVSAVSIETLTKELDKEYEKVLNHTHASLLRKEGKYSTTAPTPRSRNTENSSINSPQMNYETRLKELQTSHQLSLSHDLDFMTKLRKKAYEDCEKLFHPAAAVESNEGVNHK